MNDRLSTDRLIAAWLESEAPTSAPEALSNDIHRATSRTRPRPAWLARLGGTSMNVIEGGASRRGPRLAPALVLLVLLLIAMLAAFALVGGRPPKPDPLAVAPSAVVSTAPSTTARPSAPASSSAEAMPSVLADATFAFDHPVTEVVAGDDAIWVTVARDDTSTVPGSIHRIDSAAGRSTLVVDVIGADPASPVSVAETKGVIWVVENAANRVLRFDAASGRPLGSIAVGASPIEPVVAFDAVWTQNYDDGSLSRIDPRTGEVLTTIVLSAFDGQGPRAVAAGAKFLWAITPRKDVLVAIDPVTNRVSREIPLAAGLHCGIAAMSDRVWVGGCDSGDAVQVFDEATGSAQGVLDGFPGMGVPLFEARGVVWVPTGDEVPPLSTKVIAFAPGSLEPDGHDVDLQVSPGGMVFARDAIWFALDRRVYRLSVAAFGTS